MTTTPTTPPPPNAPAPGPPLPPGPTPPPAQPVRGESTCTYSVGSGIIAGYERFCLYGDGGIGKTTLIAAMALAGIPVLLIDLDRGSKEVPVNRVVSETDNLCAIQTISDLRALLHDKKFLSRFKCVVIDSMVACEEMVRAHVLKTIRKEKGGIAQNIEAYGYAMGYAHIYDEFLKILSDLDDVANYMHVGLVAHSTLAEIENTGGANYKLIQPAIMQNKKCPLRDRVKFWVSHLLFMDREVILDDDGVVGSKSGVRYVYANEANHAWSKSRILGDRRIAIEPGDARLWKELFKLQ